MQEKNITPMIDSDLSIRPAPEEKESDMRLENKEYLARPVTLEQEKELEPQIHPQKRKIFYPVTTKIVTRTAMIAAFYVVLTLLSQLFGLGFGVVQFRISEALTVLPLFFFSAVPALAIGCLIANLFSPYIVFEFIGVAASLIAGLSTYLIGILIKTNTKLNEGLRLAMGILPPILFNALLVPLIITLAGAPYAYWYAFGFVGLGQLAVLTVLGIPLYFILKRLDSKVNIFK